MPQPVPRRSRLGHQRRRLPEAAPCAPAPAARRRRGWRGDDEELERRCGPGDDRAVRSRGQGRQGALQILYVGGAFVQARLEVPGLGLGECAGIAFVGEHQGVLVAQSLQLGPQGRLVVVGGVLPHSGPHLIPNGLLVE
ncbi:hypothetical protein [Streptomyces hirsutus]|uniref:hypothetical protein n=1 Tax=Streptomyces hirsutus TaxID=35620 RepID=UPI003686A942